MDIRRKAVLHVRVSRRRVAQFIVVAIIVALGFWLWDVLASSGIADRTGELMQSYADENEFLAYALFSGLAALAVLLGPFTSAPVVPVALLLWGAWATLGLLMVGWLVGGVGAYMVGSYLGYPVVTKIISRTRVDAWRSVVANRLTFLWALLFRLAMPAETGYIFGLAKYPFWKFLAITVLVEFATGVVLVWGGHALVSREPLQFAAWIVGATIVFAAAAYLLRRKRA